MNRRALQEEVVVACGEGDDVENPTPHLLALRPHLGLVGNLMPRDSTKAPAAGAMTQSRHWRRRALQARDGACRPACIGHLTARPPLLLHRLLSLAIA